MKKTTAGRGGKREYKRREGPLPRWAINIRRLRELAGLQQAELRERSGVDHLGLIETGRRRPEEATLQKIAATLSEALGANVPPGVLMEEPKDRDEKAYATTLGRFLESGVSVSPEEAAELRIHGYFPYGPPTVEGWHLQLQLLRQARQQGRD